MTPRSLAADIAADIRKHGHYQYRRNGSTRMWRPLEPTVPCCIVASPGWCWGLIDDRVALLKAMGLDSRDDAVSWNDSTPTAEVLATLDRIAADPDEREDVME